MSAVTSVVPLTAELSAHSMKILNVKKIIRERDVAKDALDYDKMDFLREKLKKDFNADVIDQNNGPTGFKFRDGTSNKLPAGCKVPPEYIELLAKPKQKQPDTSKKRLREEKDTDNKTAKNTEANAAKKTKKKPQSEEQSRNSALLSSFLPSNDDVKNVQGVLIEDLAVGTGKVAKIGDRVKAQYIGRLKTTGKVFDSSLKKPFVFRIGKGEVIRGWDIGFQGMAKGGKRKLTIPPEKAYGKSGSPPVIPSNATLVFEVTLMEIM
jgi:FKBP-type peptidyl-prolyl cis-trans isomerase